LTLKRKKILHKYAHWCANRYKDGYHAFISNGMLYLHHIKKVDEIFVCEISDDELEVFKCLFQGYRPSHTYKNELKYINWEVKFYKEGRL
jgi:hypothetical protein